MRKVRFLLLTHNRPESCLASLSSINRLIGTDTLSVSVLVLDNCSEPPFELPGSRCEGLACEVRRSTSNLYMAGKLYLEDWAFADNQLADDDLVVHLDDDVVLEPTWLQAVVPVIASGKYDACGSVEYFQDRLVLSGQSVLDIRERPLGAGTVKVWQWHWEKSPDKVTDLPVAFAGHRALAVRVGLAKQVRHDPAYLIGGEDLDYSLALRRAGGKIGIATAALIQHRANGEQEIPGFRNYAKVVPSWKHFHQKWGFVRTNASSEAELSEHDWLAMFVR